MHIVDGPASTAGPDGVRGGLVKLGPYRFMRI
jgi:hypothetical protein